MKVYMNRAPVAGPWGGGNKLVAALVTRLTEAGHEVTYTLGGKCDVYVCFDPRPNDYRDDATHILGACRSNKARFICRVGDVGTHGKPMLTRLWTGILPHADDIVFPSIWARDYLISYTNDTAPQLAHAVESKLMNAHIVPNGAMNAFFEHRRDDGPARKPVNVVTHHWSDNPMKGFDVYQAIDKLNDIEFTYIGRAPSNVSFKNYIPPMTAEALAGELPTHDIYLTASRAEAGANHVLEAMACGLPVAYTKLGGSIEEYCDGFGVGFDGTAEGAKRAIDKIVDRKNKNVFTRTIDEAVDEYMKVVVG